MTIAAFLQKGFTAAGLCLLAAQAMAQNSTTVSSVSGSGTAFGTATLTATLQAAGTGVTGETISFTLFGNPVGSATTGAGGIATLSNVSIGPTRQEPTQVLSGPVSAAI